MRKQKPTVEWIVAESEAEWDRLRAASVPTLIAAPGRLRLKYVCWGITLLLLLLSGAIGFSKSTHDAPVTAKSSQPLTPLRRFPASAETNVNDQVKENGESPNYLYLIVQNFTIQDAHAVARVVLYEEHGEPMYRQTRFYQQTAVGWQQAVPVADLWGPESSLETPFFIYHFRQNDGPVVAAIAPQIDALYTMLKRNFGVSIAPDTEKLMIEVRVTQPPAAPLSWLGKPALITVASPALYLAPVEISDAELLAQSLALQLIERVSAQADIRYAIGDDWQPLLNSMNLWQLWDLALPLASWREDFVQWVYSGLATADTRQAPALPDRYADLCAAHQLWLMAPIQIGIPLLCSQRKLESLYFSAWYYLDPPIHLAQLNLPTAQYDRGEEIRDRGRTIALATLIEYAVTTYGPDRLPVLVAGLGQYDSWETLIPAVYGVSPAAFEAGWQAYLAVQYGVSRTRK